ncbi:MAG: hypothetical protein Q7R81_06815 [Candidatus Peregrinibacteria bacterium]|nr:hypothetical protein [Candidatus Peregrinibacteria bacterium]
MTQTNISSPQGGSGSSVGSTSLGTSFYDQIMGAIDPELTSASIPHLVEKYTAETDEERKTRAQKYVKAFTEYDRQAAERQNTWKQDLQRFKKEAFASTEQEVRKSEVQQMANLESAMQQA